MTDTGPKEDTTYTTQPKGLSELSLAAFEQGRQLGRDEMAFAKAEMRKAGGHFKVAAFCMAIGLGAAIAALVALSNAVTYALIEAGLEPAWAALSATGVLLVLGGLVGWRAAARLGKGAAVPGKIYTKISADLQSLKEVLK
ncbi:hypothetical protein ERN12_15265 [Rhodobacteraceae bacterium]|nr:hypothetical protein ERN12_15265 [Paracoccaceae bacterium]